MKKLKIKINILIPIIAILIIISSFAYVSIKSKDNILIPQIENLKNKIVKENKVTMELKKYKTNILEPALNTNEKITKKLVYLFKLTPEISDLSMEVMNIKTEKISSGIKSLPDTPKIKYLDIKMKINIRQHGDIIKDKFYSLYKPVAYTSEIIKNDTIEIKEIVKISNLYIIKIRIYGK